MTAMQRVTGGRKRIPIRTCVICRVSNDKRQLTRLVRTEAGIQVDVSGKMDGRGAYLCDSLSCWRRAVTTDLLSKALRTTMTEADRSRIEAHGKAL